jgi:antitoxin VapB
MIDISVETEALVKAVAAREGRTPNEIVHEALSRAADVVPWQNAARPRPPTDTKERLIAEMEEIAARGLVDPRSPDEIIGYDDFGLPR